MNQWFAPLCALSLLCTTACIGIEEKESDPEQTSTEVREGDAPPPSSEETEAPGTGNENADESGEEGGSETEGGAETECTYKAWAKADVYDVTTASVLMGTVILYRDNCNHAYSHVLTAGGKQLEVRVALGNVNGAGYHELAFAEAASATELVSPVVEKHKTEFLSGCATLKSEQLWGAGCTGAPISAPTDGNGP